MELSKDLIDLYMGVLKYKLKVTLPYDPNDLASLADSLFTHEDQCAVRDE